MSFWMTTFLMLSLSASTSFAHDGGKCPGADMECGEDQSKWDNKQKQIEQNAQNRADLEDTSNKAIKPAIADVEKHYEEDIGKKPSGLGAMKSRWEQKWKCKDEGFTTCDPDAKEGKPCPDGNCLVGKKECNKCKEKRDPIRKEYSGFKDEQKNFSDKIKSAKGGEDNESGVGAKYKYKWQHCDADGNPTS